MHLLRFKCKVTGRTYQEEERGIDAGCSGCAFRLSVTLWEDAEVRHALYKHCLTTHCDERQTLFVEVTE